MRKKKRAERRRRKPKAKGIRVRVRVRGIRVRVRVRGAWCLKFSVFPNAIPRFSFLQDSSVLGVAARLGSAARQLALD